MSEELHKHYCVDFGIETRVARFHNIYGPQGTWKGGREKAPAAFCRKTIANEDVFEMWGDGLQTRSFLFIDDCVEGILRLCASDCRQPLNIGSEEMISMNELARLCFNIKGKQLQVCVCVCACVCVCVCVCVCAVVCCRLLSCAFV